ncbi:transglutaminaseTgpA domain-containing protein [Shewanella olleyana]|uniref:transglutaminase family protein n=1 Tax=Shewanella olleyana TaxID=135626 RepID=UPI00200C021E|nr:transglutaminaseTgpA domain-containing protein [Shewanella olleyana]MCL1065466.1 transglutaminaseTgpA domain-containing protein [Shewanella olleyana]
MRFKKSAPQTTSSNDSFNDDFNENISRNTLFWLLLTNVLVLSPLYQDATLWSIGICAICFVWRVGIYLGKVAAPPKLLVTSLAIGAAATLALVAKEIGMLNALVNLLLLGYALKYIEMRQIRDVKVVVLVGYFLIAFALLERQGMLDAVHLLFVCVINACVLISVYQHSSKKVNLSFGFKVFLQSLPLALLLFVVFPRLPPLWLAPSMKNATTGISDEISLGDISKLTRSPSLAFRVGFDNEVNNTTKQQLIANEQLYWRALVMESYDGQTWKQANLRKNEQRSAYGNRSQRHDSQVVDKSSALNYQVITEPTYQKWLFGLDQSFSETEQVVELADLRLFSLRNIDQRFSYRVTSFPNSSLEEQLPPLTKRINLSLPKDTNPKAHALAQQFATDYPIPRDRIAAMMRYFNQQSFYYTLSPPAIGSNQVDDFLFENQAGFCSHYASALVFMARSSGIPARMVAGYQGGEYNPKAGYYSVYQYMAHAWTEVWLEGLGWVRFDPTAMIAPDRILDGFDAMFTGEDSYLQDSPFTSLRVKEIPWLNDIRLQLASLDFYWSVWVLGFDEERQLQVLSELLGEVNTSKIIILMIISFSIIALVIAYYAGVFNLSPKQDPIIKRYNLICNKLANKGYQRETMPPQAFATFIHQAVHQEQPQLAADFDKMTEHFIALQYQPLSDKQIEQHQTLFKRYFRKVKMGL